MRKGPTAVGRPTIVRFHKMASLNALVRGLCAEMDAEVPPSPMLLPPLICNAGVPSLGGGGTAWRSNPPTRSLSTIEVGPPGGVALPTSLETVLLSLGFVGHAYIPRLMRVKSALSVPLLRRQSKLEKSKA